MQRETEKAIKQIPKELARLNRVIAVIGQAMAGRNVKQLKKSREEFEETLGKGSGIS